MLSCIGSSAAGTVIPRPALLHACPTTRDRDRAVELQATMRRGRPHSSRIRAVQYKLGRSPAGEDALAVDERAVSGWRGKEAATVVTKVAWRGS